MFRRASVLGAMLLTAFLAICSCRPAEVLGAQIKSGDKVVTTKRAPVMKGKETLLVLEAGAELTATNVKDDWIGVSGELAGQKVVGWIDATYLMAPTDRPPSSKTDVADYPRESSMLSLPAYRIEPPDLLEVEVFKVVPRPPYRAQVYDVLQIQVMGTLADSPIGPVDNYGRPTPDGGFYLVEAEGTINLGPAYGTVRVAGMSIEEIEEAIRRRLLTVLRNPVASVKLARASGTQPITGPYLVGPDGTVNLRQYGAVHVAGKTIPEAKVALEKHLAQYFDSPEVSVDVAAYNSKVYYVITEAVDLGDNVVRVPITGNETVLDAISHVGGLSQLSSRKIWVARPAPPGSGNETILPVDWEAITRRGATDTNYQIFPRDRIFISEKTKKQSP